MSDPSVGRWVSASDIMRDHDQHRTAQAAEVTSESLGQVIEALNASLELASNAKADADRAQRISTGIAVASLAVAVGSLAIAIVAIVVTGVP